jgi:hypothetical protein
MARILAFDVLFFALPFIAYGIWLLSTRGTAMRGSDWPGRVIGLLSLAGIVLMVIALIAVIHFSASPPGVGYHPAELKDGKLVPDKFE